MRKHLIFDVDGTLWNSTPIVAKGWNRAVAELGCDVEEITPKILQREFGQPMDVIAEHLFGNVRDMEKRQALLEKCCQYEQQLLAENTEDIAYPGMKKTLERLSEHYFLYIVSNCQRGYIELVMEKNGLTPLIRDHECFGNTGLCKGETMKRLMERNGISPAEAVYIGDTQGDHEAAVLAGVPFIFAEYGFGRVDEAELRFGAFSELEGILAMEEGTKE